MNAGYIDPFAVEGVEAPVAQGGAAGADRQPDPEWQPL